MIACVALAAIAPVQVGRESHDDAGQVHPGAAVFDCADRTCTPGRLRLTRRGLRPTAEYRRRTVAPLPTVADGKVMVVMTCPAPPGLR